MRTRRSYPGSHFLLILVAVLLLLPIAATLVFSFFSPDELKDYLATRNRFSADSMMEVRLIPRQFSLLQYYRILITDQTILHGFVNSALYAIAIIGGQLLILPLLAYGLSCFRFRGRDLIAFSVVLLMVLPFQVTMVPNVLTLRALNLLNSRWAVILPMLTAPFSAFLLRQYMLSIPGELIEAAQIDSAGPLHCYTRIVLPLSRPVIGTMVALSFAECWNLVEQPLVYLTLRQDLQPLSVTFGQLTTQIKGIEFAGAALFILPSLFVYLIFQDDIMEGVQIIGIK